MATVQIATREGKSLEIEGKPSGVPGLVITPALLGDEFAKRCDWVITHQASGMRLSFGRIRSIRRVREIAYVLGAVGIDWTLPASEIQSVATYDEIRAAFGNVDRLADVQ